MNGMAEMAGIGNNNGLKYFAGKEPADGALQILLISTSQQYLEEIQKNLYVTRQVQASKRLYNLKVHTCKHISDVLYLKSCDFTLDFIVFIADNNTKFFSEVQSNLNLLDTFFGREKICIVNPNPSYDKSVIKPYDMWDFAHHHQINLINGKINDGERLTNISKRILNLMESCCGVMNGIPLIGFV